MNGCLMSVTTEKRKLRQMEADAEVMKALKKYNQTTDPLAKQRAKVELAEAKAKRKRSRRRPAQ